MRWEVARYTASPRVANAPQVRDPKLQHVREVVMLAASRVERAETHRPSDGSGASIYRSYRSTSLGGDSNDHQQLTVFHPWRKQP
jgi:hypothetical protein